MIPDAVAAAEAATGFIRHRPVMSEGIRNPAALIGIPVKYLVRRKPEWGLAWLAQDGGTISPARPRILEITDY
jgi:hypothetical protein